MTATPIPRTLGLTLYGDLDVSVIDELPGGRGRIKTFIRAADKLPRVWEFIREKLAAGRQAYVVYPRVEESGEKGLKAVTKEFENLKALLTPFRVGLLHGRLKGREKEEVMAAFRANAVKALLSTSLIEVGVDVPNATVMLVENAEQFGLAQLHQLRGRIGRGAHESYCILISGAKTGGGRRTPESAGRNERRFSHCGGGPEIARAGRTAGPGAKRFAEISFWQSGGRSRFNPAGARVGGENRVMVCLRLRDCLNGCPTWIRTNFQGVLTTSQDCLWLCIHCPLIYTNKQCLQALHVHLWEAAGRKTCANHVQEKRLCKLCANQTRPGICANLVQRFWPAVARGWPVARPGHHGRVMAASGYSKRACYRFCRRAWSRASAA